MSAFRPDLSQPQLFLDDYWVAGCNRVQRVWHAARKYPEPVITAEHPWEWNCPVAYGSVLRREGRFQAWYCGWTRGEQQPTVCYAESADGIHWTKPRLGLHEVCGTRDNNVVMVSCDPSGKGLIDDLTVIEDAEDPDWPLKALYWDSYKGPAGDEPHGIYAARSADGIHWESLGKVLPGWGDRFNMAPRKVDGRYVLLGRAPAYRSPWRGRTVYRATSADLMTWDEPELVLKPDAEDPANLEFYSATAFPYGDLLMGSIERMHMTPDRLDTELIWSRDAGRTWHRPRPRPSFIPWGDRDHWDENWVNLTANGPLVVHNTLWFYYSGRSGCHGAVYPMNHGGIGLAQLRIDGFCSLQATEQQGFVQTPAFTWPGGDLALNVDCRRDITSHPQNTLTGDVWVEVLDADNSPVEGFTADDSQRLRRNTLGNCLPILWGERSIDRLAGRTLSLRIHLRDTHLYAFKAATA